MSTYHQKSRRNILLENIKPEELFHDSPDQHQNPPNSQQQYRSIQQIIQKQRSPKLPRAQKKEKTKKESNEGQQLLPKGHSTRSTPKGVIIFREDASSSQYRPDSHPSSSYEQEQSYEPSEKMDSEALRSLNFLIRKFQGELSIPEAKMRKIKEIAQCLQVPVQTVRRRVSDFFRRNKQSSSRSQEKSQHQTIYKKTEMFDDAIKRVLRVTPYACINELRQQIKVKLDLDLAKETLIRRLKNLKYHYKKFTLQKQQRSDQKIIQLRKCFVNIYRQLSLSAQPLFFYGVVHMALDQCRGSMWMKNKQNGDLDHILYEKDVLHICIIAAWDRIEFYKIYKGFYRYDSFADTITRWLAKLQKIKPGAKGYRKNEVDPRPAYLTIECNLIHNQQGILKTFMSEVLTKNQMVPLPFPSHSSQMNPAEVLFNQIKYVTRGKLKNIGINELKECIESVIQHNIDLEDIQFAFKKVEEVYKKY